MAHIVVVVVLMLLILGATPAWSYNRSWSPWPAGGLFGLLVLVVILTALGVF